MPNTSGLKRTESDLTWPALRVASSRHARKVIFVGLVSLPVVLFLSLRVDASFKEAAEAYQSADVEKMFRLLEPLVNKNDTRAQSLLGTIYYSDVFVEENIDRARRLFDKAAQHNDPEAQYNLGYMYAVGDTGSIDPDKAAAWFQKAASQGHPAAQYELGLLYVQGLGVGKSKSEAAKWLSLAAEQDIQLAKSMLAQLDLFFGRPSEDSNIALYSVIARLEIMKEHGLAPAQVVLGKFYAKGIGVKQDPIAGLKWVILAAFQMPDVAEETRRSLTAKMTASQVKKAEEQAIEWLVAASKKGDRYIGRTAKWCHENHPGSLDCLKAANVHHEYCLPPHFPGAFKNFLKSRAYATCREARLQALLKVQ